MSAFDILHQHYALSGVSCGEVSSVVCRGEIPAEVGDVLSKHGCVGTVDGEMTDAGAMAMEVYALGKSRGERSR
jgi:hypothetical protein